MFMLPEALACLFGLSIHIAKKMYDIKVVTGETPSLKEYIINNPYRSYITFANCIGGVALIYFTNGSVTMAEALLVGYAADSLNKKPKADYV